MKTTVTCNVTLHANPFSRFDSCLPLTSFVHTRPVKVCTLLDLVPFVYECVKIGAMLALCLALIVILCVWDVHPHESDHDSHASHLSGYHMEVDGGLHIVGGGTGNPDLPEPAYQHVLADSYRAVIDARIIVGACASSTYNHELQWNLFVSGVFLFTVTF